MGRVKLERKYAVWGWLFVAPASLMIFILSFFPMIQAFILSLQSGRGNNLRFAGMRNYLRLLEDEQFRAAVCNVFTYLIIQVPIMLILALILATILNEQTLKLKGLFRTLVFLPCVAGLVSAATIFKSIFSIDGLVNIMLLKLHIITSPVSFLSDPVWAKAVIIIVITWRWTGYNTIFYLAGFQTIETSIYEAARIDGANAAQQFFKITMPLLRPVILLTTIMSTNGTLQIFDEVRTITGTSGGPGNATLTISQYIYNLSFLYSPQFGYAAAASYTILFMVAVLSFIQMKIGDKE
ncbi:MAG: sugar ABC transporter permease [Clostridiales bacterium]|jgi:lactose/L-arabinose transport system permease protein|nr:sugar ABC transporter permease [Clostridiales bacterium]